MKYTITANQLFGIDDNNQKIVTISFTFQDAQTISINSVYVDPNFRSGGLAAQAMTNLYQYLQQNNLKAVAICPYAVHWFAKNPDKTDVLVK